MLKRRKSSVSAEDDGGPEDESENKRVAMENRASSPLSIRSGYEEDQPRSGDVRERDRESERDAADEARRHERNYNHDGDDNDNDDSNSHRRRRRDSSIERPNIVSSHKVRPKSNSMSQNSETYIHMRVLVTAREAVMVIGKGGSAIARIREAANVKLNLSDNVAGATERIVNLRGNAEYVAKAAGLLVRTLHNEPFDEASAPDAKPFAMRVLMPNQIMGALIGKQGSKFREIEEASAAKLRAHEQMLPSSTDRFLIVNGVADAVHIAMYYIATTYLQNKDKCLRDARIQFYDPAFSPLISGHRGSYPPPPGGGGGGGGSAPPYYDRRTSGSSYYDGPQPPPSAPQPYGSTRYNNDPNYAIPPPPNQRRHSSNAPVPPPIGEGEHPAIKEARQVASDAPPGEELVQHIRVPKDVIGSVIGKGGQQIKNIRSFSGAQVQVMKDEETEAGADDRLITIQGTPECNQVALYLISTRIEASKNQARRRSSASSHSVSTQSSGGGASSRPSEPTVREME